MQEEMEDPDRVTPTVIDDILERELGQDYRAPYSSGKAWLQSEGDMARKDQFAASAPPRFAEKCQMKYTPIVNAAKILVMV